MWRKSWQHRWHQCSMRPVKQSDQSSIPVNGSATSTNQERKDHAQGKNVVVLVESRHCCGFEERRRARLLEVDSVPREGRALGLEGGRASDEEVESRDVFSPLYCAGLGWKFKDSGRERNIYVDIFVGWGECLQESEVLVAREYLTWFLSQAGRREVRYMAESRQSQPAPELLARAGHHAAIHQRPQRQLCRTYCMYISLGENLSGACTLSP